MVGGERDRDRAKRLLQLALRLGFGAAIRGALDLARTGLRVDPADLDAGPYLLNCRNGTVDLRVGALRPHRREDLLIRLCPVDYDPAASHPAWERFLEAACAGKPGLRTYLQRLAGYTLDGHPGKDVVTVVHGPGNRGKSTFTGALQAAFGDYAGKGFVRVGARGS